MTKISAKLAKKIEKATEGKNERNDEIKEILDKEDNDNE